MNDFTPPPYAIALGIEVGADGVLRMPFAERLIGRPGFLHGGAMSGLLEFAAMLALLRALGNDRPKIKPINVSVDFLRGGVDHVTFASGTVTRLGGRVANVEAHAWQDDREKPIVAGRLKYLLDRG